MVRAGRNARTQRHNHLNGGNAHQNRATNAAGQGNDASAGEAGVLSASTTARQAHDVGTASASSPSTGAQAATAAASSAHKGAGETPFPTDRANGGATAAAANGQGGSGDGPPLNSAGEPAADGQPKQSAPTFSLVRSDPAGSFFPSASLSMDGATAVLRGYEEFILERLVAPSSPGTDGMLYPPYVVEPQARFLTDLFMRFNGIFFFLRSNHNYFAVLWFFRVLTAAVWLMAPILRQQHFIARGASPVLFEVLVVLLRHLTVGSHDRQWDLTPGFRVVEAGTYGVIKEEENVAKLGRSASSLPPGATSFCMNGIVYPVPKPGFSVVPFSGLYLGYFRADGTFLFTPFSSHDVREDVSYTPKFLPAMEVPRAMRKSRRNTMNVNMPADLLPDSPEGVAYLRQLLTHTYSRVAHGVTPQTTIPGPFAYFSHYSKWAFHMDCCVLFLVAFVFLPTSLVHRLQLIAFVFVCAGWCGMSCGSMAVHMVAFTAYALFLGKSCYFFSDAFLRFSGQETFVNRCFSCYGLALTVSSVCTSYHIREVWRMRALQGVCGGCRTVHRYLAGLRVCPDWLFYALEWLSRAFSAVVGDVLGYDTCVILTFWMAVLMVEKAYHFPLTALYAVVSVVLMWKDRGKDLSRRRVWEERGLLLVTFGGLQVLLCCFNVSLHTLHVLTSGFRVVLVVMYIAVHHCGLHSPNGLRDETAKQVYQSTGDVFPDTPATQHPIKTKCSQIREEMSLDCEYSYLYSMLAVGMFVWEYWYDARETYRYVPAYHSTDTRPSVFWHFPTKGALEMRAAVNSLCGAAESVVDSQFVAALPLSFLVPIVLFTVLRGPRAPAEDMADALTRGDLGHVLAKPVQVLFDMAMGPEDGAPARDTAPPTATADTTPLWQRFSFMRLSRVRTAWHTVKQTLHSRVLPLTRRENWTFFRSARNGKPDAETQPTPASPQQALPRPHPSSHSQPLQHHQHTQRQRKREAPPPPPKATPPPPSSAKTIAAASRSPSPLPEERPSTPRPPPETPDVSTSSAATDEPPSACLAEKESEAVRRGDAAVPETEEPPHASAEETLPVILEEPQRVDHGDSEKVELPVEEHRVEDTEEIGAAAGAEDQGASVTQEGTAEELQQVANEEQLPISTPSPETAEEEEEKAKPGEEHQHAQSSSEVGVPEGVGEASEDPQNVSGNENENENENEDDDGSDPSVHAATSKFSESKHKAPALSKSPTPQPASPPAGKASKKKKQKEAPFILVDEGKKKKQKRKDKEKEKERATKEAAATAPAPPPSLPPTHNSLPSAALRSSTTAPPANPKPIFKPVVADVTTLKATASTGSYAAAAVKSTDAATPASGPPSAVTNASFEVPLPRSSTTTTAAAAPEATQPVTVVPKPRSQLQQQSPTLSVTSAPAAPPNPDTMGAKKTKWPSAVPGSVAAAKEAIAAVSPPKPAELKEVPVRTSVATATDGPSTSPKEAQPDYGNAPAVARLFAAYGAKKDSPPTRAQSDDAAAEPAQKTATPSLPLHTPAAVAASVPPAQVPDTSTYVKSVVPAPSSCTTAAAAAAAAAPSSPLPESRGARSVADDYDALEDPTNFLDLNTLLQRLAIDDEDDLRPSPYDVDFAPAAERHAALDPAQLHHFATFTHDDGDLGSAFAMTSTLSPPKRTQWTVQGSEALTGKEELLPPPQAPVEDPNDGGTGELVFDLGSGSRRQRRRKGKQPQTDAGAVISIGEGMRDLAQSEGRAPHFVVMASTNSPHSEGDGGSALGTRGTSANLLDSQWSSRSSIAVTPSQSHMRRPPSPPRAGMFASNIARGCQPHTPDQTTLTFQQSPAFFPVHHPPTQTATPPQNVPRRASLTPHSTPSPAVSRQPPTDYQQQMGVPPFSPGATGGSSLPSAASSDYAAQLQMHQMLQQAAASQPQQASFTVPPAQPVAPSVSVPSMVSGPNQSYSILGTMQMLPNGPARPPVPVVLVQLPDGRIGAIPAAALNANPTQSNPPSGPTAATFGQGVSMTGGLQYMPPH